MRPILRLFSRVWRGVGSVPGLERGRFAALLLVASVAVIPPAGWARLFAAPLDGGGAPRLTRKPWVSLVDQTSALIAWQTDIPCLGRVLFGPTADLGNEAIGSPDSVLDHSVPLTDLLPDTPYTYCVASGGSSLTDPLSFRTAPAPGVDFRFVAFADCGSGSTDQLAVAKRIDEFDPDLGIIMGDVIYPSGQSEGFTPRYFNVYAPTIARCAFYPALGNHDVLTQNGAPFLAAFYLPSNNLRNTERYYSFDYGDAHFVCLDTTESTSADSAMTQWLNADLAATQQRWKFVYFHHPLYSSDPVYHGDPVLRANLEPIFYVHQVDVVFYGHAHTYERTLPIRLGTVVDADQEPLYTDPRGTIYILSGGGGGGLTQGGWSAFTAYAQPAYHAMLIDVQPNVLSVQAMRSDRIVMDRMTIVKTGTASDVSHRRAGGLRVEVYPNPMRAGADILFELAAPARLQACLVDVSGRCRARLADGDYPAGPNRLRCPLRDSLGRPLPSGDYFLRLDSAAGRTTRRVVVVR